MIGIVNLSGLRRLNASTAVGGVMKIRVFAD